MNGIPESDIRLSQRLPFTTHGSVALPEVQVENYSLGIKAKGEFVGDRVNKSGFIKLLDGLRKDAAKRGEDPFGDIPSTDIRKAEWAEHHTKGDSEAHTIISIAIEKFASSLFEVIERYRNGDEQWRKVQRISVGGGFSDGRLGELVVKRTQKLLDEASIKCRIETIEDHPDEAGILGCAYLAPAWIFAGFDGMLGVDIGGTNIRCGVVTAKPSKDYRLSKRKVAFSDRWRHADDGPNRTETTAELAGMLIGLVKRAAKEGISLAPFIGVGCPGRIRPDGTIDRGAQNLPGKWEGENFNLPRLLSERVPILKHHDTVVVMHNDAVVQGLSQIPHVRDYKHWGVLTIGTGLGNAKFTNVEPNPEKSKGARGDPKK
jgi:predicted NBD/HSP70 family sugar kinase